MEQKKALVSNDEISRGCCIDLLVGVAPAERESGTWRRMLSEVMSRPRHGHGRSLLGPRVVGTTGSNSGWLRAALSVALMVVHSALIAGWAERSELVRQATSRTEASKFTARLLHLPSHLLGERRALKKRRSLFRLASLKMSSSKFSYPRIPAYRCSSPT